MEKWRAHYKDKQHDLGCIIENHYHGNNAEQPFRIAIGGFTFHGCGLDDWELAGAEKDGVLERAGKEFSLFQYGSRDGGYYYMLQSYRLQIKIPALVYSLKGRRAIPGELDIAFISDEGVEQAGSFYTLDGEKIRPGKIDCETFALSAGGKRYEAESPSVFFEISLQSICRQMNGSFYLCSCFGCLYSDYSPYGQDNIGTLFCFADNAEKYLRVNGKYAENLEKGEYTIWDVFGDGGRPCQETSLCSRFAPRVGGLGGYRGFIYT